MTHQFPGNVLPPCCMEKKTETVSLKLPPTLKQAVLQAAFRRYRRLEDQLRYAIASHPEISAELAALHGQREQEGDTPEAQRIQQVIARIETAIIGVLQSIAAEERRCG